MEGKEGIYYISSGLFVTLDTQEDLLKAEMKDKFTKEHLETCLKFFDSIKQSKLKTF